jgi:hypothetical protein
MSDPIQTVLTRLEPYGVRPVGRDRWRSRCPAHNGDNVTALSIGVGDNGAVLLRCWRGCEADQVAIALGLELHDLFPPRPSDYTHTATVRRRMLSAGQAIGLLSAEAQVVFLTACDMHRDRAINEADYERLGVAVDRIAYLAEEVRA